MINHILNIITIKINDLIDNSRTNTKISFQTDSKKQSFGKIRKQKVKFHNIVNVRLIQCIDDYKKSNLIEELWWSNDDYIEFKKSFIKELNDFQKIRQDFGDVAGIREVLTERIPPDFEETKFRRNSNQTNLGGFRRKSLQNEVLADSAGIGPIDISPIPANKVWEEFCRFDDGVLGEETWRDSPGITSDSV